MLDLFPGGTFFVARNFPGRRLANPGEDMPYTRPIRRFYLTPPSVVIFVASLILAILAVLATYGKLSIFNASYAFLVLLIAYLLLLAGNLFRGV
jgi:hypothetical protein